MLTRFRNWLILEDENMPTELKLGNLDHLDGLTVDQPSTLEVAA